MKTLYIIIVMLFLSNSALYSQNMIAQNIGVNLLNRTIEYKLDRYYDSIYVNDCYEYVKCNTYGVKNQPDPNLLLKTFYGNYEATARAIKMLIDKECSKNVKTYVVSGLMKKEYDEKQTGHAVLKVDFYDSIYYFDGAWGQRGWMNSWPFYMQK